MVEFTEHQIDGGRTQRYTARRDGRTMRYDEAVEAWANDAVFVDAFVEVLRACPHEAYFWETPPITTATVGRAFEFVLVDSPALARVAGDAGAFREHFAGAVEGVVTFRNLGGDAMLIAPSPIDGAATYAHLSRFVREAPEAQVRALWRQTARAIRAGVDDQPMWVSTSGLGIYWLHVRLDRRPKYYTHAPYKEM